MIAPRFPIDFEPTEGQIWRERGAGMRFVKVLESPRDWVRIKTCDVRGELFPRARVTLVEPGSFKKRFFIIRDKP